MIDKIKISREQLSELHEKASKLDPEKFNLDNISHSGRHIHDIIDDPC